MTAPRLGNIHELKAWINSQDWYQEIHLSNGLITPGKYSTQKRLAYFSGLQLEGKTFLDIGCNSGAYCLWAKKQGAKRVVGIDINRKRLEQAKILSAVEGLHIEFNEMDIFNTRTLGKFDIVFCISVLTEVQNIVGALDCIQSVIGERAFLELALAKPLLYLSKSKHWVKGIGRLGSRCVFELRETNAGYMICPTIQSLNKLFGPSFKVDVLGSSVRYDMVRVEKQRNMPN